jgi:hypothetical protein
VAISLQFSDLRFCEFGVRLALSQSAGRKKEC